MYSWKSWHDSRHRLILYAGACLVVGLLTGLDIWGTYHRWVAWRAVISERRWLFLDFSLASWEYAMNIMAGWMLPAVLFASLLLGTTSVGREYGSGAMVLVITRPQKRWRIVWDEWALSVSEICIILSMLALGMVPFLLLTSRIYVGFTGLILPAAVAMAACLYGLTQFLTLLTRSSAKGLSATIAVILFYIFLPGALDQWWHISWPAKVTSLLLSIFDSDWNWLSSPVWEITFLWAMMALIFPFMSQWLIERREV